MTTNPDAFEEEITRQIVFCDQFPALEVLHSGIPEILRLILTLHRSNQALSKRVEVLEKRQYKLKLESNLFDIKEVDL